MENSSDILVNFEKDNEYSILKVLKNNKYSRVEKVSKSGKIFIRKYYNTQHNPYQNFDILSCLNHPVFPQIHDSYQLIDQAVVVEEYIEGISLNNYVKQNDNLSPYGAVVIALELCEAVSLLHSQEIPIIHRDIKPDNIIWTNNGIRLIDFNISRTFNPNKERDTVYMGTAGYSPPE
jgi:serine/threonine protein kinase